MKTKKKGLVAALSVTLASAILISASAATLKFNGLDVEAAVEYNSEKVSALCTIPPSVANTNDNASKDDLNGTMIIPKDFTGNNQAVWGFATDRDFEGSLKDGVDMGDGIVLAWKIKANEEDLKAATDDSAMLFQFDNKFRWQAGEGFDENEHEDALLSFSVKDYKDAPKDENGYGTFVMKMTEDILKNDLGAPANMGKLKHIQGRLRTGKLAELTIGDLTVYKVDDAGQALTNVQNAGSTVTAPEEPEPPEEGAKVITEIKGSQVTCNRTDENDKIKVEGDSLTFGPGSGGSREFNVPAMDATAGTVYKVAVYLTISDVMDASWAAKFRPQNEYYFLTDNGHLYDAAAGGTQKVIVVVPFKAAGNKVELNTILEGFTGSIDKVVLATNDYDFGKDQGDYKLNAEYGRQELDGVVHPEYPRYEGSQLDAGDPGKEGEGWKASTKADKPVDPDKPDPEPNPEGVLLSLNGSQAAVHTDAILFTEAMHKANIKGDSYDFTNAVGRELYGFYMDAAKPVKDTTYKMAFYLTLTGIEEGKEGAEFKFRPANEYYYNLTNEELYNTEVGGTQKVIVSVPVKYTGERLEGYIWNTGGLKGTLDKVVLAAADYDLGVKTDDYAMISEDIANAGSNKDAMAPEEGSWKPSTVEEVKAADDNNNGNNGDNGNNDNNDNNNGNNDNNGNNGNNGDVVNPGDNNNPVTGAVGVAAGTVMLAAAAAATLVLTKKRK